MNSLKDNYSLHGKILTRQQPSGRIFNTKVNFTPVYVRLSSKIKYLINIYKEENKLSWKEVSLKLTNKPRMLDNQKRKISLLALINLCNYAKNNLWETINSAKISGKSCEKGAITLPIKENEPIVDYLLVWIRTEGYIELGSTHIEINQKNGLEILNKLKEMFKICFNLRERSFHQCKGTRGEDRLIISSSPLRQILVLKYGCNIGYKTGKMQRQNFTKHTKQHYLKLLAVMIETEGCLSRHYTRNKKRALPRFEFIVKDKNLAKDCFYLLKQTGFNAKHSEKNNIFKVGLYTSEEVIRLIKKCKPFLLSTRKINHLKELCPY